ncbi:MAG: hypothetical protein NTW86_20850 [Candidatus Sumerlaeota bacterium]|nr:hypothetical protein [Candidatus Sumerlaeota bacterium]
MLSRPTFLPMALIFFGAAAGGEAAETAALAPKPYEIGVAPSHITISPNPLFESDAAWASVADGVDLYKYYGVQTAGAPWATAIDCKSFVACMKKHGIRIGCEFGDFHLGAGPSRPDPAEAAIRQIQPVFDAGGEVASIHLDGPERRMIRGINPSANALSLDEVAAAMVDFWRKIRTAYPRIQIGLITNLPNWDYSDDLAGYNGHYTDQSGATYLHVLETFHKALAESGERIDFVEVDYPCNYYLETQTRKKDAPVDGKRIFLRLQEWLAQRHIGFHMIVNAEPRNLGAQGFHDLTLEYVRRLRRDGVFPDVFIIQSWYKEPADNLPETAPLTFMNTAADAMRLIRRLYPTPISGTSH